jgi:hypothetical protein
MVKVAAVVLIIIGAICLLLGASWDTTPSGYVNFHAVSQQQTLLMIGGFTFLGGLVTLGFERMRPRATNSYPITVQTTGPVQSILKAIRPEYRLRLAVGVSIGVPIAYWLYWNTPSYISYLPPIITMIVAVVLSIMPGATGRRLKQILMVGAAILGLLFVNEINWIIFLWQEIGVDPGDFLHLFLITALGVGCIVSTKFVDQWVARLPDE